ncbi:MAG: 4Fe-4S dicluster domain-containing protein [Nitrospinota bacterium]
MEIPGLIDREGLNQLINTLNELGYQVIGPSVKDEAIVYETLKSVNDLPEGWTDEQEGGFYRLKKRKDKALFGYVVGPHSWKKFLHPPERRLWKAELDGIDFKVFPEKLENPKYAFIGVRSCELHAISIQDKVFLNSDHTDPVYQTNRKDAFLVAVQCGQSAATCFCTSMNTGPRSDKGFDLALTEIIEDERHYFVVEVGSEKGSNVLKKIAHTQCTSEDEQKAIKQSEKVASTMQRNLDTNNIKDALYKNIESPQWEKIAERCLSCANCTMVCPTCFCSTVEDVTDITGNHAERWQKWDSCFTMDFTNLHGGKVRASTKSQYRQWLTHKLASWQEQFDSSGCVGCGRCITWCPVGIDLTEEVPKICSDNVLDDSTSKTDEA